MTWKICRIRPGAYEAHDGVRVRAVIIHREASRWLVYRIRRSSSGAEQFGGSDYFRTLREARAFCVNRPEIWGK